MASTPPVNSSDFSGTNQWQSPTSFAGIIQSLQMLAQAAYAVQQAIKTKFPDWVSVPATASSPGTAGQVAYDSAHFYVCVAPSTWVRVSLSTF